MKIIGVISDTHFSKYHKFTSEMSDFLSDVSLIVHAGDIGDPEEFEKLKQIAPVVAVMGNKKNDKKQYTLPDFTSLNENGYIIYVTHGLSHGVWDYIGYFLGKFLQQKHISSQLIVKRIERNMPKKTKIVVYGHTHYLHAQIRDNVLFLNPGAAFSIPGRLASAAKLYLPEEKDMEPQLLVRYFLTEN
ncbi:MAG: metallophosphoesterase family protein [Candidatus Woesebacteria bacterium]